MEQYREAKEAFPDAILFFRLDDFYEMFNDDAVVAARELQLTLTSRNKNSPDPVPMAGVPYHAAHGYVAGVGCEPFARRPSRPCPAPWLSNGLHSRAT